MITSSLVSQTPQSRPWEPKIEVLNRSVGRCVLRTSDAKRFVAIRVRELSGYIVKIFMARYDGGTVIENYTPVYVQAGDFDDVLTAFAAKI